MSIHPARRPSSGAASSDIPTADGLRRRDLMRLASVAAAGAAVTFAGVSVSGPAAAAAPRWPGHKPGQIYLGASSRDSIGNTESRTGTLGLWRTYYKWGDGTREDRNIKADHAARRLPWISFKPPVMTAGGWAAIIAGRHDSDIRARARRYASYSRPVVVTFNHEPHNDKTGTAAEFAAAWTRIHDVMNSETGLKNVVSVPIIGEWVFNPVNKKDDPSNYLTQAVLNRCHFLGIDLYQNQSGQAYDIRLARIVRWLDTAGHSQKMVGIGETGCTNNYGTPSGAAWWNTSWRWAAANTNRVGAISYFNSLHNNNSGNNWLLTESTTKLNAYRASLGSAVSCRL